MEATTSNERTPLIGTEVKSVIPTTATEDPKPHHCCRRLVHKIRRMMWYDWFVLILLTALPCVGGFTSSALVNTTVFNTSHYQALLMPTFAPPAWVFAPVWVVLYLMIGFASYLIWETGDWQDKLVAPSLVLFFLQLLLNWLWIHLFFGTGMFAYALLDVTAMWAFSVATVATFIPQSCLASLLMIPYILWLGFATALNFSVVCLNGCSFK